MFMNEKALKTLEYDKIIEKLTACATSPQGKALCAHLSPSSDLAQICQLQMETSDALARIYRKGSLSFSGVTDIQVSAQTGKLVVSASDEVDDAKVLAAVEEAGYTAVRV